MAETPKDHGAEPPFWQSKRLEELDADEWEALCDGCGRCCLVKLEDIDTGDLMHTALACRLLDHKTCRCTDYANRLSLVPDCVSLDPGKARDLDWLPPTCAYRLRARGEPLRWWHPLVSGTPATVIEAGISVRGRITSETGIAENDLEDHCADWPAEDPDAA